MPGAEACAGAVWAWDSYNVLLCAVVTLGIQGVFFCVAAALRFDKVLPQHPESPTRWQPTSLTSRRRAPSMCVCGGGSHR